MKRTALPLGILAVVLSGLLASAQQAGDPGERIGQVTFNVSCKPEVQKPFDRAAALLHSFWYLESAKQFSAVAQADPGCAMAHWGIALSLWYQLWAPASPANLKRGLEEVEKAKAIGARTPRERDFIGAAEAYFKDHETLDHRTRTLAYERAMEPMAQRYPADREVAIFYALALQAAADPHDKTYARQRKSAEIAEKVFAAEPDHPGAAHYIIHGYDYPSLAPKGLDAARRYDRFAPSAPHALHMPSHIYVLLGMWPETIKTNLEAAAAEKARGNPDDRMHAMDYLVYGYLQQAQDQQAKKVLDEGRAIMADLAARKIDSGRHTARYAIAAMEARWAMERGEWSAAAEIAPRTSRFAYADSMIHFARAIGAARAGNAGQARAETEKLAALRDALTQAKNAYWAEQVEVQRRAAAGWTARAEGKNDEALALVRSAAELEESTEKHNITPGPIATARELLGDLLLELGQPAAAAREFERSLQIGPSRFKAIHGVAHAAARAGDTARAREYYAKLVALAAGADTDRPALREAKAFLAK